VATLDRRTNLKLWLEADTLAGLNDGDTVASWLDLSGNSNDFTAAGTSKPLFKTNILNGRPAVLFDGVNDVMTGPLLNTFLTAVSGGTIYVVAKPTAITANSATPALNDGIFGGSVTNSLGMTLRNNAGVYTYYTWAHDGTNQKNALRTFAGPNGWYIFVHSYLSTLRNILDDPYNAVSTAMAAGVAALATAAKLGENWSGVAWFTGYIAAVAAVNVEDASNDDKQHTINYFANKYFSPSIASNICTIIRGDPVEQGRDIGSRRLWGYSTARPRTRVVAPLTAGDAELLDLIALSHPDWPHPTGGGAGNQDWARAVARVDASTLDLDALQVELDVADMRSAVTYRETARAVKQFSALRQGDAVLSASAVRTFARQSNAWIPDAGDGRIVQISPDMEALLSNGMLLERGDTNQFLRSSFISGTTGLTLSVGSGAIAVDSTTPLLFDTSVTTQGLRLTAGNPHVTETRATWPVTASILSGTKTRVWIDHVDRDGTALNWRLQRAIDAKWWRDSDQTWQVATTDNPLPVTPTTTGIVRDRSKIIDVGASNTTLTLVLVLPAGGTASRRNTVYHVQLWGGGDAIFVPTESSRIVTNAATYTRAYSILLLRQVDFASDHWTFLLKYTPYWDPVELGTTFVASIADLGVAGTNNSRNLSYGSAAAQWTHSARDGAGSTVTAFSSAVLTPGTSHRIAIRATGTAGELGLASRTASIFVNGVKGTDAQSAAAVDLTVRPSIALSASSGITLHGLVELIELRPVAMTDEQIAAWGV